MLDENIYHILGRLHTCEGYIHFYKALCLKEGKVRFCELLISHTFRLNLCAEKYCSMGEYKRQDYIWEMKVKENIYGDQFLGDATSFGITVPQMPRYIKNCSIGQFFFRNLITMNDFYITATKLNKSMGWYDASVAAVVYQGEIVAAIHVFEGKVLFVITDKEMKENAPLYNAVKKWSEKYNLKFNYFE